MPKANVIMFTTVWYIGVPRNYLYACWKIERRYKKIWFVRFKRFMNINEYGGMLRLWCFYYFYLKFKWNLMFETKLKGISALCLKFFILTSPTTLAGPNYICMTEELLNDYHLLYIKYSCVFIIRELARILTAILRKLPITTDRSKPIIIL